MPAPFPPSGAHARPRLRLGLLGALFALAGGCADPEPVAPAAPAASAAYDRDGRTEHRLPAGARPPNLVLVLVDALRADALEPGIGGAPAMPGLAALAARGVWMRQASAPAPSGLASLASVLTANEPGVHRVGEEAGPPSLAEVFTTLTEALGNGYGYETLAWVAGPWSRTAATCFQGFATLEGGSSLQGAPEALRAWARTRDPSRPFFLLVHSEDARAPYGPAGRPWPRPAREPAPADPDAEAYERELLGLPAHELFRRAVLDAGARARMAAGPRALAHAERIARYAALGHAEEPRPELVREVTAAYRDGLRWVDGLLERTVAALESEGLLEGTLLAVAGTHGEALGEQGTFLAGGHLHEAMLRVPLVLVGPAPFSGGRTVDASVGLLDLGPTFLALAGMAPLGEVEGRPFGGLVAGGGSGWPVVSREVLRRSPFARAEGQIDGARSARWKHVVRYDMVNGLVLEEAFDLAADPGAAQNLARDARVHAPGYDAEFCRVVDDLRSRVESNAQHVSFMVRNGYVAGYATDEGLEFPPACP